MTLNSNQLDLIAAALNFAYWHKGQFQQHLIEQGHAPTAQAADGEVLDELRQQFNAEYHDALDREWEETHPVKQS